MILVMDYMRDWLVIRGATVRPRTLESYERAAQTICAAVGDRCLDDLTPAACAAVYAPVVAAGHLRTAQIVYSVMRMALSDAVGMHLLAASPMETLHRPRHDAAEIEPYTADEVAALCADPEHGIVWRLLAETGIRRGEAAGLRWSDVDYQQGCIHVRQQATICRGRVIVAAPKSETSVRPVPISEALAAELRRHAALQMARGRFGDYVISEHGELTRPDALNRWLRRASSACGVVGAKPHRFRHTFGAHAVAAGVEIRVLQVLMGHSDISVTAKYYTYVSYTVRAENARRIRQRSAL